MDTRYQDYCLADRFFYDVPAESPTLGERFLADRQPPPDWKLVENRAWTILAPPGMDLQPQGWKIHVSACAENAKAVLGTVWDYCVTRAIPFKFLSTRADFLVRNAKYADRGGSGKFITVYPLNDDDCAVVAVELSGALAGQQGPYILSDARIADGPVHVRYGGFIERFCLSETGDRVPAISDPNGVLLPDLRQPVFRIPGWVKVPEAIQAHVTAREATSDTGQFPYSIREALHFTNGGGIYEATDNRTGLHVVLREARPHAGLDGAGRDAVERLHRARSVLRLLEGLPCVPELHDYFTYWEHHYIAEEFIEGQTLGKQMAGKTPIVHAEACPQKIEDFTAWALGTLQAVEEALDLMHHRGVVFGDLHPHNIIIRADGTVCFIDFEAASMPGEMSAAIMGAPGYVPPDRRSGMAVDSYAMACLKIAMFLPLTPLIALDVAKAEMLLDAITSKFPVPSGFCQEIREGLQLPGDIMIPEGARATDIAKRMSEGAPVTGELAASLVRAIDRSATPQRSLRLFPGDIKQFSDGAFGIACGAAGVLHALHATGHDIRPEYEEWLLDAVKRSMPGWAGGFYDGLHGAVYVLDELGRRDLALDLLRELASRKLDDAPLSLYSGLAGIGLNLLYFGSDIGDQSFLDSALNIADRMVALRTALARRTKTTEHQTRTGLMHGGAGRALFFIKLYEVTRMTTFLDIARDDLCHDLDECTVAEDGTLQVDEGRRLMPYLATGSAGIGLVLDQYLRHRHDARFESAVDSIINATKPEFVIGSGLFNGRAGFVALLAQLRDSRRRPDSDLQTLIDRHLARLSWHIVSYKGDVAFTGDQLMRISMDLSTGSAGILLVLAAGKQERVPVLPLVAWSPRMSDDYPSGK